MASTLSPASSVSPRNTRSSDEESLRVSEIFFSLQGETSRVGLPTVFVRLAGCPLRCGYCDTEYAFYGGRRLSITAILAEVCSFAAHYVTVTGGEPLAQKECLTLLKELCNAGYSVSLETSGALDISKIDTRVSKIMDIKTPGSGEVEKNLWSNLNHLAANDEVKFVLCDEVDYRWAIEIFRERQLDLICPILFSPVYGRLDPATLAGWVLRDRLPVRMQIQLHKVLWGEGPGR
ncbi:7-carboxy-7-deazaguanine synthase QueE [Nitrosovibrio tenuis]|uniref:7-carboxy-7-deazaguanine synthase n=1 Tax=Nitrosovibrio tenuis TaxID=1233 RepID=A0A1H7LFU4_9PROT|nr:7-carboxy-7-deazaguanine synthase QueE [Nitrosovibrio tenuis]SEK97854.1 7-carboxy-7-deazaguanine synthase [Nitrosovibrio tenuis]